MLRNTRTVLLSLLMVMPLAGQAGSVDQNSVTGKIDKLIATQGGVLIKVDAGIPFNCGSGYNKPLMINEQNQTMVNVTFRALDENREITFKTLPRRDMDELCVVQRIVWK